MLDETARGVYVIAVTPFTDEGVLDLTSIDRMVDFYEGAGSTASPSSVSSAKPRS